MTEEQWKHLVSEAAEAIELFGEDELERYAEEQRKQEFDHTALTSS
jgi:hypothetical protein